MVAPVLAAGGALSTAMPVIGSVVSGLFGRRSAKKQNEMQMAMAREQMQFQERMSSTAHQREVKDLMEAGLNPILSGTGGAGSSSPSGAMAPIVGEEEMPGLGQAASSAMAAKLMAQELANAQQMGRQLKADAAVKELVAEWTKTYGEKGFEAGIESQASAAEIARTRIPEAQALEQLWKSMGEGGEFAKGLQTLGPTVGPMLKMLMQLFIRSK